MPMVGRIKGGFYMRGKILIFWFLEPKLTNVPNSRHAYRVNALAEEMTFLKELAEMKVNIEWKEWERKQKKFEKKNQILIWI